MKIITKKIHAILDYPVAFALITLPFLLDLGSSNTLAFYLSVITGVAALALTLITDHQTGVVKLVSYKLHLTVDFLVAITFILLPILLGFKGIDLIYYLANGFAVLLVVGLHKGEASTANMKENIAFPETELDFDLAMDGDQLKYDSI